MKIYTKTGDRGKTALIGGTRVPKYHLRIESYGTIDELMSYIGLLRDEALTEEMRQVLLEILDRLMSCAAILAADCEDCNIKIPEIYSSDVEFLEKEIDKMEDKLDPLTSFILPGGHPLVSYCHIARCVCRRAERIIIQVAEKFYVPDNVIKYINRLSDFLFVLARKMTKDLNVEEILWRPRL